jgi:hypothetical protein
MCSYVDRLFSPIVACGCRKNSTRLPSLRAMTKAVVFDFMRPQLAGDRGRQL